MKIGVCVDWHWDWALPIIRDAGADFVEFNLSAFENVTEEEVTALAARLKELGLVCLSYNGMMPGGRIRVTGPRKDFAAAGAYLDRVLKNVMPLGPCNVVFGSCGSRILEEGDDRATAMDELTVFLRDYAAPAFRRSGHKCSIEPLSECNLVHTVDDGLELAKRVSQPEIGLLIDYYHTAANGEDMSDLSRFQPYLCHTHIACSNGRVYPRRGDGDDYVAIFRALEAVGYDACVSVEGRTSPEQFEGDVKEAIACLKEAYAKSLEA